MQKLTCRRSLLLGTAMLLAVVSVVAPRVSLPLHAQGAEKDWEIAAGGKQAFEVASVRPDKTGGGSFSNFSLDNGNAYYTVSKGDAMAPTGSLFSAKHLALMRYIIFAYKLNENQELALRFDYYKGIELHTPNWVRNDAYDIEARAPGAATKDQMRLMMQSLLADRFKLAVHWETREAPVFALAEANPGKLGPQLKPHPESDDCANTQFPEGNVGNTPALNALPIPCGMIAHLPPTVPTARRFGGRNVTLAMLAQSLPGQTGLLTLPRPVIDEKGLRGGYDFWMEWTPEDTSEEGNSESGGTFREALKNQLGLKLEPQKGPVEVQVIDHVEQPSAN